ncbi:oxygen-dependent protoporphyrinogen oxidase [Puccinia graminis f. sp. tritici]|uniref:Protoporphyrinogen oxidase n=2 Tax=Puccinia graminis f. sp. tritici TaxID=56615 RepID=A0A5B0NSI1_PUCGR|nr:oxygen-dependent protoporphyrinogen oxidase [Puccinia graminis f. sp. tritici]KAA1092227.1 oxygen-dependent protoporphyrinogen oxidase [Puccinia graminis f. sp. tritici]KAA1137704.1 oxygen-dependent protoporphyrinogen oxidase, variant 2 [Puccinia graminis f. sp. tritici]
MTLLCKKPQRLSAKFIKRYKYQHRYSSAPASTHVINEGSRIGILGGGLAGLTSAYYLSKQLPESNQIIVWEKAHRFGGWVQSSRVDDQNNRTPLVFESGPRSVRPKGLAGLISIELIKDLKLLDSVIVIPKTHPSAQNRYIYTKNGLQKLPSSMLSLLRSIHKRPISLIPGSLLKDIFHTTERSRTRSIDDESIHEFISRRFGDGIGEELISGMVHGIYAGDYKTLSVRSSLFKSVWELERKHGGVLNGLRASQKKRAPIDTNHEEETLRKSLNDHSLQDLVDCSVWGLKGGLETLVTSLRDWLEKKPNVILKSSESIESVVPSPDGPSTVTSSLGVYEQIDHLISALPPQVLHSCLGPTLQSRLEVLTTNPSVTVGVVNLAYRSPRRLNPIPPAFGYLIPASIGRELNPHRVLGVVFDSDMMPGVEEETGGEELTKLTVMMGGHYYSKQPDSIPTNDELIKQACQTIKDQLGIAQEPFFAQAQIQKDCIPQYLVGHHRRMSQLHHQLAPLNLSLVGSGYSGVGLNDVVKSARDNVINLIKNGRSTGLEDFDIST